MKWRRGWRGCSTWWRRRGASFRRMWLPVIENAGRGGGRRSGEAAADLSLDLVEIGYVAADGAEQRVSLADAPRGWCSSRVHRCVGSPRVRGSGTCRAAGGRPRSAGHVGYESWLERDHLMLLDFDPDVVGIAVAAVLAVLDDRGGQGPVARAGLLRPPADGSAVVIDCRPVDRIKPRDAAAFAATGAGVRAGWAGSTGWSARRTRCGRRTCGGWSGIGIRATTGRRWPRRCGRRSPRRRR